jgi:hypothetical protein
MPDVIGVVLPPRAVFAERRMMIPSRNIGQRDELAMSSPTHRPVAHSVLHGLQRVGKRSRIQVDDNLPNSTHDGKQKLETKTKN